MKYKIKVAVYRQSNKVVDFTQEVEAINIEEATIEAVERAELEAMNTDFGERSESVHYESEVLEIERLPHKQPNLWTKNTSANAPVSLRVLAAFTLTEVDDWLPMEADAAEDDVEQWYRNKADGREAYVYNEDGCVTCEVN